MPFFFGWRIVDTLSSRNYRLRNKLTCCIIFGLCSGCSSYFFACAVTIYWLRYQRLSVFSTFESVDRVSGCCGRVIGVVVWINVASLVISNLVMSNSLLLFCL